MNPFGRVVRSGKSRSPTNGTTSCDCQGFGIVLFEHGKHANSSSKFQASPLYQMCPRCFLVREEQQHLADEIGGSLSLFTM